MSRTGPGCTRFATGALQGLTAGHATAFKLHSSSNGKAMLKPERPHDPACDEGRLVDRAHAVRRMDLELPQPLVERQMLHQRLFGE
jgi:hypothetical protein